MLKIKPKWDDELMTNEEFRERKEELAELVRKIMNQPDFQPTFISGSARVNRVSFEETLIEAFEKVHGGHQNIEGLYFKDLGHKIPGVLITKVFEDLEISKEVFQERFRVEMENTEDWPRFFAIKV